MGAVSWLTIGMTARLPVGIHNIIGICLHVSAIAGEINAESNTHKAVTAVAEVRG